MTEAEKSQFPAITLGLGNPRSHRLPPGDQPNSMKLNRMEGWKITAPSHVGPTPSSSTACLLSSTSWRRLSIDGAASGGHFVLFTNKRRNSPNDTTTFSSFSSRARLFCLFCISTATYRRVVCHCLFLAVLCAHSNSSEKRRLSPFNVVPGGRTGGRKSELSADWHQQKSI